MTSVLMLQGCPVRAVVCSVVEIHSALYSQGNRHTCSQISAPTCHMSSKNAMREAPSQLHTIPAPLLFPFPGSELLLFLNLHGLCLRLCFNIRLKRVVGLKPEVQMIFWCFCVVLPYSGPQKLLMRFLLTCAQDGGRGRKQSCLQSLLM